MEDVVIRRRCQHGATTPAKMAAGAGGVTHFELSDDGDSGFLPLVTSYHGNQQEVTVHPAQQSGHHVQCGREQVTVTDRGRGGRRGGEGLKLIRSECIMVNFINKLHIHTVVL